jgi:hypothetical protein
MDVNLVIYKDVDFEKHGDIRKRGSSPIPASGDECGETVLAPPPPLDKSLPSLL